MNNKELSALITLLDDTDSIVYNAVREKLLTADEKIIPDLSIALNLSKNNLFIKRAISVITELRYIKLDKQLIKHSKKENNLLFNSYLISKYKYPDIIYDDIEDKLIKLTNEIRSEANFINFTGLQKVRRINHFLYDIQRFKGDFSNIFNSENSYINKVVETKKGNDISLAIIYLFIAEKLGIPIYGVNFPGNFLLGYKDDRTKNIMFYINPVNKGEIITKKNIEVFIKTQKIKTNKNHFATCNKKAIIKRLLNSLLNSYLKINDVDSTEKIKRLQRLIKN